MDNRPITGFDGMNHPTFGAGTPDSNFAKSVLSGAIFLNCNTLHRSVGLDDLVHERPSFIDWTTLKEQIRLLPRSFLVGLGLTPDDIGFLLSRLAADLEVHRRSVRTAIAQPVHDGHIF